MAEKAISESMNTSKRIVIVLWKLTPLIASFIRDYRRYIFWGSGRALSKDQHLARAKALTVTLEYLGPTFIKLAQVLSARADVLPPTYIKELSALQDKVNPTPTAVIAALIREELRRPIEAVFERFDDAPLAAASLGQVHRARYRGEEVAIKVLRPGVKELVLTDLKVIFAMLSLLNIFIGYSPFLRSITTVLTEFRRVIQEEMNFALELRNIKIFQNNLRQEAFVRIPKAYEAISTPRVIVLEYMEGVKINHVAALEAMGIDIDVVIQRLARLYIRQVMIDGFLHADPHPGNILVDSDGRIIILDFGMVIKIDGFFKLHLIKYAVAIAHHDVDSMVHEMYELQLVEPGTNKAMLRELAMLMLEIQEQGKLSKRKVQEMTNALMNAFYEFPFTLPSELVYIGRAASLIEGIGFIHDPWFDAVDVGRPIITEMGKEILQEELGANLLETLQRWTMQSYQTISAFQDTVIKLDREQLRLHAHPADLQTFSTMAGSVARRILGGMSALLLGMFVSARYIRTGDASELAVGAACCALIMLLVLLLPNKVAKPQQQRFLQKRLQAIATEEGDVYKSFVIGQMSAEERQRMEEEHQRKRAQKASPQT